MSTVLLIIQLIISVILTGLILIQKSEGGALGIGGGGGGGFMSGRSATTSIARMTGILGTIFLINCLALAVVFNMENQNQSIFDDTNEVGAIIQTVPEGESNTLSTDTIETAPLTEAGDSSDGVTPLADETLAVETPEIETTPEASDDAAQEPKPDE